MKNPIIGLAVIPLFISVCSFGDKQEKDDIRSILIERCKKNVILYFEDSSPKEILSDYFLGLDERMDFKYLDIQLDLSGFVEWGRQNCSLYKGSWGVTVPVNFLVVDGEYGLFLNGNPYRNNLEAFNIFVKLIKPFTLDNKDKVLQYIDFYYRVSMPHAPYYRVNSISDIWHYDLYRSTLSNKDNSEKSKDVLTVFNKSLMTESLPESLRSNKPFATLSEDERKVIEKLKTVIEPATIEMLNDTIRARIFVADNQWGNVAQYEFDFLHDGTILNIRAKELVRRWQILEKKE